MHIEWFLPQEIAMMSYWIPSSFIIKSFGWETSSFDPNPRAALAPHPQEYNEKLSLIAKIWPEPQARDIIGRVSLGNLITVGSATIMTSF